jgi:hypothetical protein
MFPALRYMPTTILRGGACAGDGLAAGRNVGLGDRHHLGVGDGPRP